MSNLTLLAGVMVGLAFAVNIIVQCTKKIIALPTNLWCIVVALIVNLTAFLAAVSDGKISFSFVNIICAIVSSFFTAFIAMYGFNTLKDLWSRFKKGENINEDSDNKKL